MAHPPQLDLLQNFNGYVDVFDIFHPIPVTMEQMVGNPPMFVSLTVKDQNPKLVNFDAYLINGHFPENLIDLDCDKNLIEVIPPLPDGIELLSCNTNNISNLSVLPDSLQYIYCDDNQLSSLPQPLPRELVQLTCNENNLNSLPNLNDLQNLKHLECNDNQLTQLPVFYESNDTASGLSELECAHNLLLQLPNLPSSLTKLNCSYNQIHVLPDLPTNLTKLNCSFNQLFGLPNLNVNLRKLNCASNPIIGSLANIVLPDSLRYFYCFNCQITNFPPTLPPRLKEFMCSHNPLVSLPNLPDTLKILNCTDNGLTVLPDLPNSLRVLFCRGNNFDDQSINKIIAFYQRAIRDNYRVTNPTFQEELDYFQRNRTKTFYNTFAQNPIGQKGLKVDDGSGIPFRPKPIPSRAMENILVKAGLPLPPGNLGGTKKRKVSKRSKTRRRKVSKRTKKVFKRTKKHFKNHLNK